MNILRSCSGCTLTISATRCSRCATRHPPKSQLHTTSTISSTCPNEGYASRPHEISPTSYLGLAISVPNNTMAPRRSATSATRAPAEPPARTSPQLPGLQFDEPLSWKAGKPIPVAELLRRLDTLSKELRDLEQEECDKDSFRDVAQELAGTQLLTHKDRGVRAYTACCLVDILRICAPDAPFTASQLKVSRNYWKDGVLLSARTD